MSESSPFVRFRDVEKTYDGRVNVVDRLNLDLRRGEFLTLLGPSGSGKTTTLMMLAGFESPTAGEILLAGRPLTRVPTYRRNMGLVFQNYALFPHMTVAENLAYPLRRRGQTQTEIAAQMARAVEMVELDGLEERYPAQLSGGQQQRVALARALIFEPDLVLMDEPLGALDKNLREQMQLEIKHLHGRLGMTVVYVTHDQSEALTMSDRVAVFHDGIVQQVDTPQMMYERPANHFVADFIGENNALAGTVRDVGGEYCHVALEDGLVVEALPMNAPGSGERATVSIRPERIEIHQGDTALANRLDATIVEIIYFGDHVRMLARTGERDLLVKLGLGQAQGLAAGAEVTLGWRPEHCIALAAPP